MPSTSASSLWQKSIGLPPNLVRGPVIDAQGLGTPAHVHAQRAPRERRLENSLPQVPGEEQAAGPVTAQGGEKAEFGHADVLSLVNDAEIVRRMRRLREMPFQKTEQAGLREALSFAKGGPQLGKNRPQNGALRSCQTRLAAEPCDVPVVLPALELPGVDDVGSIPSTENAG